MDKTAKARPALPPRQLARELALMVLGTALVAAGEPSLWNFSDQLPDPSKGVWFNLYNNMWDTNFPLWYGEDARFRFVVRLK